MTEEPREEFLSQLIEIKATIVPFVYSIHLFLSHAPPTYFNVYFYTMLTLFWWNWTESATHASETSLEDHLSQAHLVNLVHFMSTIEIKHLHYK